MAEDARPKPRGDSTRPTSHADHVTKDWEHLGHMVERARVAASYRTVRSFAQAIGIPENRLYRLENGRSVGRNVLVAVELGLGWGPGSIDQILEGQQAMSNDDPQLDNDIEVELWNTLKLIKGLTHGERLAHLEMHRKFRREQGQMEESG